jgi:hypothetical protein
MAELNELWINMLDIASKKAIDAGRHDMADYIRLKLANDTIRATAVKWLFDTTIEAAFEASQTGPAIMIERNEPHKYLVGASNMVGEKIQIQQGVRCLTVEAGWARTPSDGIMRNGSLAHARINHFGMPGQNADFRLVRADPLPVWLGEGGVELSSNEIRRHLDIFLAD